MLHIKMSWGSGLLYSWCHFIRMSTAHLRQLFCTCICFFFIPSLASQVSRTQAYKVQGDRSQLANFSKTKGCLSFTSTFCSSSNHAPVLAGWPRTTESGIRILTTTFSGQSQPLSSNPFPSLYWRQSHTWSQGCGTALFTIATENTVCVHFASKMKSISSFIL